MSLKLAMGQMLVEGGQAARNLERAARMIADAASLGCRIIVLPECLDIGWTYPEAPRLARPIPGEHSGALARAAQEAGVYVVAGLTERAADRVFNAAILIDPAGDILLKHRKINELTIAQDIYAIGNSLSVVDTSLGVIGLNICADNFANSLVLGHALARMGARIILAPSAWAVWPDQHTQDTYRAKWVPQFAELATLYELTVVSVSNVGPMTAGVWAGRLCIGSSLAVGPDGSILAEGPFGADAEALVVVEVEITPADLKGTAITDMLADRGYHGP